MCFLWLSVHRQHAKNNSANMREAGSLRFPPQTPISNRLLNVIPRFSNNFLKTFISLMKQKMQSLFTFQSSNAQPMSV